jgi:hypothetical protein
MRPENFWIGSMRLDFLMTIADPHTFWCAGIPFG